MAEHEERERKFKQLFARANAQKKSSYTGQCKRKNQEVLLRYLDPCLIKRETVRPLDEFSTRHYNLGAQVTALVDHMFVLYPTSLFLYRTMLTREGRELVFGDSRTAHNYDPNQQTVYRDWFFTVAQGGSLAKSAKDTFTKKEAHLFLNANVVGGIEENFFWAKAMASGLPKAACDYFLQRLPLSQWYALGDRQASFLNLMKVIWPEMKSNQRNEMTDYLSAKIEDQKFSFKGKDFGEVKRLSAAWHKSIYNISVGQYRSWIQAYPEWVIRKSGYTIKATELTNNRALAAEGREQRHCVFGYTSRCVVGASRIISFRWYPTSEVDAELGCRRKNITVEVLPDSNRVVQVRGLLNRKPSPSEMEIVRIWAGNHGLIA